MWTKDKNGQSYAFSIQNALVWTGPRNGMPWTKMKFGVFQAINPIGDIVIVNYYNKQRPYSLVLIARLSNKRCSILLFFRFEIKVVMIVAYSCSFTSISECRLLLSFQNVYSSDDWLPRFHQMEPLSPIQALGLNPFSSRFKNRTVPWGLFERW